MNWEALGAAAEVVGAVAVVVSLIYLALQVKSNTESTRTSTYQSVVAEFGELNRSMASTPDMSMLFIRGMEDFESLTPDERARCSQLFFVCFHNFENMYYQYRKGYLEYDVWIGWQRIMLAYYARPGFQVWWSQRSDVFNTHFVEFLRTERPDRPIASYYDVAVRKREKA